MLPALLGLLTPAIKPLLDLIPNPAAREKARMEFELQIKAQEMEFFKLMAEADKGQVEINKIEAANPSIFVSGWRPFVGWVCGVGFAWATVVQPVLVFTAALFHHPMITPQIQTEVLMQALLGLLGMGGFRMMEKKWGVASK